MSNSSKRKRGIPGAIKGRTLCRKAGIFFRTVHVENDTASKNDIWLVCGGMKILDMQLPVYVHRVSEAAYARLISDFIQADLEPLGLRIGKPIPNEYGGFTYLVCR